MSPIIGTGYWFLTTTLLSSLLKVTYPTYDTILFWYNEGRACPSTYLSLGAQVLPILQGDSALCGTPLNVCAELDSVARVPVYDPALVQCVTVSREYSLASFCDCDVTCGMEDPRENRSARQECLGTSWAVHHWFRKRAGKKVFFHDDGQRGSRSDRRCRSGVVIEFGAGG